MYITLFVSLEFDLEISAASKFYFHMSSFPSVLQSISEPIGRGAIRSQAGESVAAKLFYRLRTFIEFGIEDCEKITFKTLVGIDLKSFDYALNGDYKAD